MKHKCLHLLRDYLNSLIDLFEHIGYQILGKLFIIFLRPLLMIKLGLPCIFVTTAYGKIIVLHLEIQVVKNIKSLDARFYKTIKAQVNSYLADRALSLHQFKVKRGIKFK